MKPGSIFPLLFLAAGLHLQAQMEDPSTLKGAFREAFSIGCALDGFQINGRDTLSVRLAREQFNSITAGNAMKWERIHPRPGVYRFEQADRFVSFGEQNGMQIVGHTLVWHNQTPPWVFRDGEGNLVSRDTLLARMREHITTVVGRYRGKVRCWDVVNEAVDDDGNLRNSLWYQIIGADFIERAFTFAREADPDAVLIYNDYSLANPSRRDGVVRLVGEMQRKGIRVDGIGMQGHYLLESPDLEEVESSLRAFSALGVRLMITELDVSVLPWPRGPVGADINLRFQNDTVLDPYKRGLPDQVQAELADRYRDLFRLFLAYSHQIDRVTFWGIHDGLSWKNNFPVRGRTDYPLLFDRAGKPKPAFHAVLGTATRSGFLLPTRLFVESELK